MRAGIPVPEEPKNVSVKILKGYEWTTLTDKNHKIEIYKNGHFPDHVIISPCGGWGRKFETKLSRELILECAKVIQNG
jgi:hypothetical protein